MGGEPVGGQGPGIHEPGGQPLGAGLRRGAFGHLVPLPFVSL